SSEFIGARVIGESFDAAKWWSGIQRDMEVAPLAKVMRSNPEAIVVVGISSAYLPLVGNDLTSLEEDDLERLRLVGLGIESSCPSRLRHCILPYDNRLDGPDSSIRGTRGDFSSRAMRDFIECLLLDNHAGSLESHKAAVQRRLQKWRRPESVSRQP